VRDGAIECASQTAHPVLNRPTGPGSRSWPQTTRGFADTGLA